MAGSSLGTLIPGLFFATCAVSSSILCKTHRQLHALEASELVRSTCKRACALDQPRPAGGRAPPDLPRSAGGRAAAGVGPSSLQRHGPWAMRGVARKRGSNAQARLPSGRWPWC